MTFEIIDFPSMESWFNHDISSFQTNEDGEFEFEFPGFNEKSKWSFNIINNLSYGHYVEIKAKNENGNYKKIYFTIPNKFDISNGKAEIKDGILKLKFNESKNNQLKIEFK